MFAFFLLQNKDQTTHDLRIALWRSVHESTAAMPILHQFHNSHVCDCTISYTHQHDPYCINSPQICKVPFSTQCFLSISLKHYSRRTHGRPALLSSTKISITSHNLRGVCIRDRTCLVAQYSNHNLPKSTSVLCMFVVLSFLFVPKHNPSKHINSEKSSPPNLWDLLSSCVFYSTNRTDSWLLLKLWRASQMSGSSVTNSIPNIPNLSKLAHAQLMASSLCLSRDATRIAT